MFPQAVAAQQHYRYIAVRLLDLGTSPQPELDKYAADGWELAAAYMQDIINGPVLIFRK